MKSSFKSLSLIMLIVMLLSLLSGCGNSEKEDTSTTTETTSESNDTSSNTGTDETAVVQEDQEDEEMVTIDVMILSLGAQGEGALAVEEKLNEITEKEINTHVTLHYVEPGQYSQQLNLAIAGGENIDVVMTTPIPPAGFTALTSSNSLVPLNDLLEKYGQDALATVGDLVKGTTINGTIYALPSYRDLASGAYILMRKDLLEQAGLLEDAQAMETWDEYTNIMKKITEQFDINGTGANDADGTVLTITNVWLDGEKLSDAQSFDNLGDNSRLIASDDQGNVINYYKSEHYKAMIGRVRDWYKNGLVFKDSATSEEIVDTHLSTDTYFSATINGELGSDVAHSTASGKELMAKKITSIKTGTGNITKFGWAIPVCSTKHEAAAKFLNILFKSAEVNNLLAWGIEGVDYVVENGFAKFPEGITRETVPYHTADFLYGNQFLVTPWEGSPEGIRELALKEMEEGGLSKYLGFSCDTSVIVNELTAVSNVINEYKAGLDTGMLSEAEYDKFIEKLDAAGAEKVVAEYQKQLDAWLANN